ncbi:MAG: TRAP transporter substrate-binding protein DctP, partial [Azoarcus sp. PHD]
SNLQDVVMETSFAAQQYTQREQEKALIDVVGAVPNPGPDTVFGKNKVRVATLSDAEILKAEKMCSPEYNPKPWEEWRERLSKMSGGQDVYKEIFDIAREIPKNTAVADVKARRWWQNA